MNKPESQKPASNSTSATSRPIEQPAPALKPSAAPLEGGKLGNFSGGRDAADIVRSTEKTALANEGTITVAIRTADTVQPSPPKK